MRIRNTIRSCIRIPIRLPRIRIRSVPVGNVA